MQTLTSYHREALLQLADELPGDAPIPASALMRAFLADAIRAAVADADQLVHAQKAARQNLEGLRREIDRICGRVA